MTILVISGRIGILRGGRWRKSWPPATRTYALEVGEHGGGGSFKSRTQGKKIRLQASRIDEWNEKASERLCGYRDKVRSELKKMELWELRNRNHEEIEHGR